MAQQNPEAAIASLERILALHRKTPAEALAILANYRNTLRRTEAANKSLDVVEGLEKLASARLPGTDPLRRAAELFDAQIADNTAPAVAAAELTPPIGRAVVGVEVAGPGIQTPDIRFELANGTTIGRELTSLTIPGVRRLSGTALAGRVNQSITNQLQLKLRAGWDPAYTYSARELALHLRDAEVAAVADRAFLEGTVMPRVTQDLGSFTTIRFYDSTGRLTYTWRR
jgi:hypothetical protein